MGLGDRGREPCGLLLIRVEAHLESRAIRQRLVARLDDDRCGRWLRRGSEHERRVGRIVVRLHFRLDRGATGWDARQRELHLVQRTRVRAVDDALRVALPQLVLAGVRLVPDYVGVVRALRADLRAL